MERSQVAAVLGAVGLLVASLFWYGDKAPDPGPVPVAIVEPAEPGVLTVHVSGAVRRPGVVEVPVGARVADAVTAAGGAAQDAVLMAINLAAPLSDGQQIVVPDASSPVASGAAPDGRIAINRATAGELEGLAGVGPVLAGRIVSHREQFGPFESVEDLLDVPGIGESKLASLKDQITVP
ncbi:MAG: ComEA family DNA-binding protein [Acidimicrobiia bacterium]|nr:ComEA family DNA-binding protein [Acidimicrobiia bacterium]